MRARARRRGLYSKSRAKGASKSTREGDKGRLGPNRTDGLQRVAVEHVDERRAGGDLQVAQLFDGDLVDVLGEAADDVVVRGHEDAAARPQARHHRLVP